MNAIKYIIAVLILIGVYAGHAQTIDTLLNVGNYRLHFTIRPGNGIPILFESGNGDDGSVWNPILDSIYKSTQATLITYDRAGLGTSEIDTTTIRFEKEVENLTIALKQLDITEDLFLVCHSLGGFYATAFANQYSGTVKGVTFIDGATSCFMTPEWARSFTNSISEKDWPLIKKHKLGTYYVLQNFEAIARYMQNQTLPKSIPVTVLIAEHPPAQFTEADKLKWKECLRSFGSSPNRTYILAKGAEHKIWSSSPALVIDSIVKLYKRVK